MNVNSARSHITLKAVAEDLGVAPSFMQGVATKAESAKYGLLLVGGSFAESEKGGAKREVSLAAKANVDSFVLYNLAEGDLLPQTALARNLPSVLVDSVDTAGVPSFTVGGRGRCVHCRRTFT